MTPDEVRLVLLEALGGEATTAELQALAAWATVVTQFGRVVTDSGVVETNNWGLLGCGEQTSFCARDAAFDRMFAVYATPVEGVKAWWLALQQNPTVMAAIASGSTEQLAKAAAAFHGFAGMGAEPKVAGDMASSVATTAYQLSEPPAFEGPADGPSDMQASQALSAAVAGDALLGTAEAKVILLALAWAATKYGMIGGQPTNNWSGSAQPADGSCPPGTVTDGRGCVDVYSSVDEGAAAFADRIRNNPQLLAAVASADLGLVTEAALAAGYFGPIGEIGQAEWLAAGQEIRKAVERLVKQPGLAAEIDTMLLPPAHLRSYSLVDTSLTKEEYAEKYPTEGERPPPNKEMSAGRLALAAAAMLTVGVGATWALERAGVVRPPAGA